MQTLPTSAAAAAAPRNLSPDTIAANAAVIDWARRRWLGCRIITEFALGRRRVDILVVCEHDIIAFEVKSRSDKIDGRLKSQLEEYARYIPEVWLAADVKHIERADAATRYMTNMLVIEAGEARLASPKMRRPIRDELVCSRLIELLWNGEALAIAARNNIIPAAPIPGSVNSTVVRNMLARLLTGNEIIREVCRELRSRPLCGIQSDKPVGERNDLKADAPPMPPTHTERMAAIRDRMQRGGATT